MARSDSKRGLFSSGSDKVVEEAWGELGVDIITKSCTVNVNLRHVIYRQSEKFKLKTKDKVTTENVDFFFANVIRDR